MAVIVSQMNDLRTNALVLFLGGIGRHFLPTNHPAKWVNNALHTGACPYYDTMFLGRLNDIVN